MTESDTSVPWLACCNQGLMVAAASLPFRVDDRLQLLSNRSCAQLMMSQLLRCSDCNGTAHCWNLYI
jgi:hypothetical protein